MDRQKVARIVENFGLTDIADATYRMGPDILAHFRQEGFPAVESREGREIQPEEIVDVVYERVEGDGPNYTRPVVHCSHFSELLVQIGQYFGKSCSVVEAHPVYLGGHSHALVHNQTDGKYMDPSVYRKICVDVRFEGGKRIETWSPVESRPDFDMADVRAEWVRPI